MRIYLRMSVMVTLDEVRALVVPCYTLKIWKKKLPLSERTTPGTGTERNYFCDLSQLLQC